MREASLRDDLRLYLVTDEREDAESMLPIIRQAIAGGVTAVQLRRKLEDGRRFVEIGHAIRAITHEAGVLFFVNDRVDVALLCEADGVHVGQDDISCQDARRLLGPEKLIGVSARTLSEAEAAIRDGADYLGVGSIYPTSSKADAKICGLPELDRIVYATHSGPMVPIVAIGGISEANASDVFHHGADGIAVVSAIMSAADPAVAAGRLLSLSAAAQ